MTETVSSLTVREAVELLAALEARIFRIETVLMSLVSSPADGMLAHYL
jgi:hypothetical protein